MTVPDMPAAMRADQIVSLGGGRLGSARRRRSRRNRAEREQPAR